MIEMRISDREMVMWSPPGSFGFISQGFDRELWELEVIERMKEAGFNFAYPISSYYDIQTRSRVYYQKELS